MTPAFNAEGLPPELRASSQWVDWRGVIRNGRPTKFPIDAKTGAAASSTDPRSWATFDAALAYAQQHGCGVGFVFTADDPYVGVDFDKCRDPETGSIQPWAISIIRQLNSYTEISPSCTGLHVIVAGKLNGADGRRKGPIEIYQARRFFCMTGNQLDGTPARVEPRQEPLDALMRRLFPPTPKSTPRPARPIGKVYGERFQALMRGEWQSLGFGSQSEADLALVSYLARSTGGNVQEIDANFRASGLMREKWNRADYRERTIARALQ